MPARSPTLTSRNSTRKGLRKPRRYGSLRISGSWPPSKYGGTPPPARAFWPLVPLPPVLTLPLPWPRPIRVLVWVEPAGGRSSWIRMALIVLQDADEVRDFVDHAAGDGRIAVLDHLVHFSQAQGADRGALALSAAH